MVKQELGGTAHCPRTFWGPRRRIDWKQEASVRLEHLTHYGESVLALGSHGVFDSGRAPALKRLLRRRNALLLVRAGALDDAPQDRE